MGSDKEELCKIGDQHFDADKSEEPFGKRYGDELIKLSSEQIKALQDGKFLAVDVQSEYVLYLHYEHEKN